MNNVTEEKKGSYHNTTYRKGTYGASSLIPLGIVALVWLIIFFMEISMSLKAYSPIKGIIGSPWVGFKNYNELFSSLAFGRVLQNTIVFNLLFAAMVFGIALIMGHIILSFPKGSMYRDILAILFILPLFLSGEVYTGWLIELFGSTAFVNPRLMRILHPLFSALKYSGIPIMVLYVLDELQEEKNYSLSLKAAGLFALTSLAFIANSCFSLTKAMYNPMVYESLDMLDTYSFRKGLMENQFGLNSAVGVVQTLLTLLSVAALSIPIKFLFKAIFKEVKIKKFEENLNRNIISSVIALFIFAALYFMPYILNGQPFSLKGAKPSIVSPIVNYLVIALISAFIASSLAALISKCFISLNRKVVYSAAILLSLVTILAAKPNNISQYLMIKSMGAVNTGFAIILATGFSAAAVWAMICIVKMEGNISSRPFFLGVTAIFLIQTALIYSNSTPPQIYFHNINLSPNLIFKSMSMGMQNLQSLNEKISFNNVIGFYGFIISLPSLLLFTAAKLLIPKTKLIAIITGGMKS